MRLLTTSLQFLVLIHVYPCCPSSLCYYSYSPSSSFLLLSSIPSLFPFILFILCNSSLNHYCSHCSRVERDGAKGSKEMFLSFPPRLLTPSRTYYGKGNLALISFLSSSFLNDATLCMDNNCSILSLSNSNMGRL